ncbi:MAG TPA: branched-chain-amino-acid transaminase [Armatimonadota bacterium]|nr:branched-chain-amino-acid transaminase [Armatimonadota bacterium]HOM80396.1 branched-chain-amino-acid transaminase [Armatimonadota bacterium]HPU00120.1 branched-chain-amino-acid transaminase [Armatimonadota bacterium]
MQIYINGELVPEAEAKVSVFDHGLLYGDGAFEGIRAYGGRIFRLHEHVDRLFRSAQHLAIQVPVTRDGLAEAILRTARANNLTDGYIRVTLTRGVGLGLDPKNITNPTLVIIASQLALYPREMYENGLELVTVALRVPPAQALEPRIKSLGKYVNNILAKMEANRAGAGEGLMLSSDGYVAEATGDNIFILCKGEMFTPPAHVGILEGITRAAAMELARRLEIPVSERMLTLYDIYNADECFLTGTAAEIVPAVKVDGRLIGTGRPGPLTKRLMAEFRALVAEEGVPISR